MDKKIEKIKMKNGKEITKIVTTVTPKDGLIDKKEIEPSLRYKVGNYSHYGYAKNVHYEMKISEKSQRIFDYVSSFFVIVIGILIVAFAPLESAKIVGFLWILMGIYFLIAVTKNQKKKDDDDKHTK